ncbi:MAG: UDP-2,3-diacylglucosamine diphosphatase [Halomonas sp.]|uniref:UDP-2,3-diacylglucosamine hydrolase n=1 Tax=Billgrantia tianxiuensis TaxID=2497861 RepID=A0A6I6STA1_9GAMM|nr:MULTISPECIES: UDP-2,3-diacylglucosamine diphosphatase [Halomonas]MCE8031819.1 UDP-2,3-diacylglucosamine diphosphatase [Halomonas sp. MCCC 1A11057]MDX5432827.1 UDP-2,3-diacylglucosamine diphosphatase [Halomonas sp.]QHC50083.1 UDP-2,3-diacylglucosamine diphosphatase [Halomonas tianxiuensis]
MSTTLLISDLHLHPGAPEVTEGFLDWLDRRARGVDTLYILGDFFEAWIGDDLLDHVDQDPSGNAALALRVATALRQLTDDGTALYLMHGNRDFLLGHRFADAIGAKLVTDPAVLRFADEPVLLMHGDSLCTRDEAYMAFREQARNPAWQEQVLAMPLADRIQLATALRQQSGEATSNKAEDIMDVTPEEVERVMRDHGVTTLIHGHTHRPAVHEIEIDDQPARRIVLGDWQPGRGWEVEIGPDGDPVLREIALQPGRS